MTTNVITIASECPLWTRQRVCRPISASADSLAFGTDGSVVGGLNRYGLPAKSGATLSGIVNRSGHPSSTLKTTRWPSLAVVTLCANSRSGWRS